MVYEKLWMKSKAIVENRSSYVFTERELQLKCNLLLFLSRILPACQAGGRRFDPGRSRP